MYGKDKKLKNTKTLNNKPSLAFERFEYLRAYFHVNEPS